MSGYLHRLAASATQPSRRIHPFLGSVFTPIPPQPEIHADTTPSPSRSAATPRMSPAYQPQQAPPAPPIVAAGTVPAHLPHVGRTDTAPELLQRATDRLQPLIAPHQDTGANTPSSVNDITSPLPELTHRIPEPLLRPTPALWTNPPIPNPPSPLRPTLGESIQRRLPTALRATQPPPAPEISIHIGRIEVTAFAPPAPRPAPAPARTTALGLETYLRRREERAG